MFKISLNRALLELELETRTPLLIRAGDPGLNPAASDLAAVRIRHPIHGKSVYIPGSSMKGVLRSAAEAAVRGRKLAGQVDGACDVFGKSSCGERFSSVKQKDPGIHRQHCGACRTFGSTALKGRATVRDLFPWCGALTDEETVRHANTMEVRHGVAINRMSGAVQNGPFDMEMVPPGARFFGEVALENYQVWQLGLVAMALDELNDGFAQLGSTKSRGLGGVRISVRRLVHEQTLSAADRPMGVARLEPGRENAYGLLADPELPAATGQVRGLRRRFEVRDGALQSWLDAGLEGLGALLGA